MDVEISPEYIRFVEVSVCAFNSSKMVCIVGVLSGSKESSWDTSIGTQILPVKADPMHKCVSPFFSSPSKTEGGERTCSWMNYKRAFK